MERHNKRTFVMEYCRCRKIPYRLKGDSVVVKGQVICPSVNLFTYRDLLDLIDSACVYEDEVFVELKE